MYIIVIFHIFDGAILLGICGLLYWGIIACRPLAAIATGRILPSQARIYHITKAIFSWVSRSYNFAMHQKHRRLTSRKVRHHFVQPSDTSSAYLWYSVIEDILLADYLYYHHSRVWYGLRNIRCRLKYQPTYQHNFGAARAPGAASDKVRLCAVANRHTSINGQLLQNNQTLILSIKALQLARRISRE